MIYSPRRSAPPLRSSTHERVLVINTGSSSLKYQLLEPASGDVAAHGLVDRIGTGEAGVRRHVVGAGTADGSTFEDHAEIADAGAAVEFMVDAFAKHGPDLAADAPVAVGHRVVHGGAEFTDATVVDDHVVEVIRGLIPLAPLHNPAAVTGLERARQLFAEVPHVAVFDTAFHATLPPAAYTYAVSSRWRDELGVRRYGFHGTSHRYVAERAAALMGRDDLALVTLHLGNGCSATAVLEGRSVETSMGFTPLEGLVMGTRSGDIDPSISGYLEDRLGQSAQETDTELNTRSGLLGLTGHSDFRTVVHHADAGDPAAVLALEVATHRLVKYVGGYAAVMGRLDAVVFTGGIGEHSAGLREAVLRRLALFDVRLDAAMNRAAGAHEMRITHPDSAVAAWVIPTDEELQIARESLRALADGDRGWRR